MREAFIDLGELLASGQGHQSQEEGPKILPEAAIMRLRDFYEAQRAPNPFKPGDLVTPRHGGQVSGIGDPHLVIEVDDMPRFFSAESPSSSAYGMRPNVRVICLMHDHVAAFWVEHWHYEPYTGDGA